MIKFLTDIDKDITEIKMDDINRYLSDLSIKPDGAMASGSYLVAVYSALKKFFKYLVDSERIVKNPMDGIERPAPKKVEMVERTYLTKSEIKKVFKNLKGNDVWTKRNRAILVMFFFTGIRNTALTEINVQNVDFENNCIYVVDKGSKPKPCYLDDDKMMIIKDWVEARELVNRNHIDALFISEQGKRIVQGTSRYVIEQATEAIGHKISPHKARASFATNALNSGLSLYEVSKLMGNQSLQATSDAYQVDMDDDDKLLYEKVSRTMNLENGNEMVNLMIPFKIMELVRYMSGVSEEEIRRFIITAIEEKILHDYYQKKDSEKPKEDELELYDDMDDIESDFIDDFEMISYDLYDET